MHLVCRCEEDNRMEFSSEFDNCISDVLSNESLLVQILARLPCRDAVRCKLVCKCWRSLISSDYFIRFFIHLRHLPIHDPNSSYRITFQFRQPHALLYDYFLLVHFDQSSPQIVVQSLDLGFLPCPERDRISVTASCADLILCKDDVMKYLYVCNPLTKQWVALPPHHPYHYCDKSAIGLLCDPAPCSFGGCGGVDNSRCKFMVMRINIPFDSILLSEFQVQIFSSVQGQWINYELTSSLLALCFPHAYNLVPLNGKLHWLNFPYIFVFDPLNAPGQISRVIDLHHFRCAYPPVIHSFGVFNNHLRVSITEAHEDPSHRRRFIWELEDYDKGKWRSVQKLRSSEDLSAQVLLDGNIVCFENDYSITWLCNNKSDGAIDENKYELIPRGRGSAYIFSSLQIADQCWPTPIPSLQLRP